MNYLERLSLINKDHDKRTVWTSIDRPMKPIIYQLHRIGLKTQFCCCGFDYPGQDEDEPKTHHSMFPYVFVWSPFEGRHKTNDKKVLENFDLMTQVAKMCKWTIGEFNANRLHLFYQHTAPDLYKKNDGIKMAIHDYEEYVLAIHQLTKYLGLIPTLVADEDIDVEDGNKWYFENGIEEWQILPKLNGKGTDFLK